VHRSNQSGWNVTQQINPFCDCAQRRLIKQMARQAGKTNRKREMKAVWYSQDDGVWNKVLRQLPRYSPSWSVNILP
jgi:hypothetical protein